MKLDWLTPLAGIAALGLAGLGALFLSAPDTAMGWADHDAARLPQVLGGRYLFLALALGGSLWLANDRMSALICAGFAMMAAVDAALYSSVPGVSTMPHFAALALSLLGTTLFLLRGRSAVPAL